MTLHFSGSVSEDYIKQWLVHFTAGQVELVNSRFFSVRNKYGYSSKLNEVREHSAYIPKRNLLLTLNIIISEKHCKSDNKKSSTKHNCFIKCVCLLMLKKIVNWTRVFFQLIQHTQMSMCSWACMHASNEGCDGISVIPFSWLRCVRQTILCMLY